MSAHSDFNVTPAGGNGHYAGNMSMALSAYQPTFAGGGYKVQQQWRRQAGDPIPPHLYSFAYGAPGTIPVVVASDTPPKGNYDTYDSSQGAYGGMNVGPAPTMVAGAPMPQIVVPTSVSQLPSQGNVTIGTATRSTSLHCNNLSVTGTLTISGNVTILCDGTVLMSTGATIALQAGARLTLYLMSGGASWNHTTIGDPLNPSRVTIFNIGASPMMIHNHANVYATIVSPSGDLQITNHGALYGRFIGRQVDFDNHSNIHIDRGAPLDNCGIRLQDTPGTRGVNSSGGVASAASFAQWYQHVPGVNLSNSHTIGLTRNGSVYEYLDNAFFPIDGQLFGNEGSAHNYFFTFTFSASFTHEACMGRFMEFEGADDCWIFIDGQLAMDLGGVLPATRQYVEMDRLNLVNGQIYTIRLFYAQRNPSTAIFRLRTNVALVSQPPAAISGAFD